MLLVAVLLCAVRTEFHVAKLRDDGQVFVFAAQCDIFWPPLRS